MTASAASSGQQIDLLLVLVGAHLRLRGDGMAPWLWAIVGVYVMARSMGKILGANLGGRWTGAPKSVRRHSGMCLFCQGRLSTSPACTCRWPMPSTA